MTLKKMLRKQMREIRDAIPEGLRASKSFYISKLFMDSEIFSGNKVRAALVYLSFGSEFDTSAIIKELRRKRADVYIPRVNRITNELDVIKYDDGLEMEISDYGIREPVSGSLLQDLSLLDLIVVPGLAFSTEMDRLGYGGGFYDKLIVRNGENAILAAPAFDEQIVDRLPTEPHDRKIDFIVSDRGLYKLK